MKFRSLFPLVVFLALATMALWSVEVSGNESMKAGTCPFRKPVKCFRYKKPQCKNDWQCPEKRKCCPDYCGIKCLDPVPISNPVKTKPGMCPVVNGECLMLNPPNHCETDSQCDRDFKCCKGMCGKACVPPVAA
ncbi:antileukoproteinase [Castor canadensis]|uniref:Antileukoproteinase n=2 Tax=Castor canadensis TaxID=51338 RepID=A0AC58MNI5_CASCN